jgi:2,4-diketo-3-deoxy-L-fuconate hydrolase
MFKLATIKNKGAPRVAIVLGERLHDVETAVAAYRRQTGKSLLGAIPGPITMLGLLERWSSVFRELQRLARFLEGAGARRVAFIPAARARFLAPILYPPRMFAAGSNYNAHSKEMTDVLRPGTPYTTRENSNPYCFLKASIGPVIGHRDKIMASLVADPKIDYEGELAVVIGKKGRFIKPGEARAYVAGYTIVNDVSARTFMIPRRLDFKLELYVVDI